MSEITSKNPLLSKLRRFFSAPTRSVDLVLSLLTACAWKLGPYLAQAIAFLPVPRGQEVVFTSPRDLQNHLLLAKVAMALIPLLAWQLACFRGYRRREEIGLGLFLALTGILVAVAAIAGAADMLLVHHLWVTLLAEPQPLKAMVSIGSLTHWEWALKAELVAAALMAYYWARKTNG